MEYVLSRAAITCMPASATCTNGSARFMMVTIDFEGFVTHFELAEKSNRMRERLCVEDPLTQGHGEPQELGSICLMQRVQPAGNEEHGN